MIKLELPKDLLFPLADLLFQKYKDSQIRIKDHFQLVRGKTPSTKNPEYYENGNIKWINSGVLTNLYFLTDETLAGKLITEKAVQECNYGKKNSVLITRIQLDLTKIAWCRTNNTVIGDSVWNLIGNNDLENSTLFFALRYWTNRCGKSYLNGSIFQLLRSTEVMKLKINWVSNPQKQRIFYDILNNTLI